MRSCVYGPALMTTPSSELDALRVELTELRERTQQLERGSRARRRTLKALLGTALLGVLSGGVAYAANGNCPNGLPECFAANTPAMASAVNLNFAQLKEWLEQKVGTAGTATVTMSGPLTVSQINAPANNLTLGSASTNITVPGTLTLGLGASAGIIISQAGPLPISQTFTTEGGSVMLFVSGSGYGSTNTPIGLNALVDGNQIGTVNLYVNVGSNHSAFVPRMFHLTGLAAGAHTLQLTRLVPNTGTDLNDRFEASFVELPL
jgi:hypothetical protein